MPRTNFENLRVYQLSEELADKIWDIVVGWDNFASDTAGKQIVRSADSIGANIAEGEGRGSYQDNRRFIKIARGSLQETQHWLRRAFNPRLSPTLNAYLRSIGTAKRDPNDEGQMTKD